MPGPAPDQDKAAPPEPERWLTIDVVHDDGPWESEDVVQPLIEAAADALARHPRFLCAAPAQACVALSSDAAVRRLNKDYRGKDKPTNVLSFPAPPMPGAVSTFLGDVVLAHETISAEAAEGSMPLAHHLQHLTVHGLLHLLGFDHETETQAAEMETLETAILAILGVPDPYTQEKARVTS